MGYATNTWPGDGTTKQYEFDFVGGYLDKADVKAYYLQDGTFVRTNIDMNTVTWVGPYTLLFPTATLVGFSIVIYRETPRTPLIDFENTSRITEANLNKAYLQALFVSIEAADVLDSTMIQELMAEIEVVHQQYLAVLAAASSAAADANAANLARVAAQAAQAIAQAQAANAMASATSASQSAGIASSAATAAGVSAGQAAASQLAANASQLAAAASAATASAAQVTASAAAVSADADANDAAAAATLAQSIKDSLAGGTIGFGSPAYDLGSVTDPVTYFNRDLGLITDPI